MPPTNSKLDRKYNQSMEKEEWAKGWLSQYRDGSTNKFDPYYGYCKLCDSKLKAKDVRRHLQSQTHEKNAKSAQKQRSVTQCGFSKQSISEADKIKKMDIALASCVGVHTSVRAVDHIGELIKKLGERSVLEKLQLHRTKCTAIIKNVISPSLLKALVEDIGQGDYSLIMDESTGVSTRKYFAMMVKYYSIERACICTDFLGMFEVHDATSKSIADGILQFLKKINLAIKQLVGIGTDGASTMCGIHQSVYTELKKQAPNLQLVKCVCHSLHLCGSHAGDDLNANVPCVDYLCREIYNHFSNSPKRREKYRDIFDTMNLGEGPDTQSFLNFVKLSGTRWLSFHKAVERIFNQWEELKLYFSTIWNIEKDLTSKHILDYLNDDSNYLYFAFLEPILQELSIINRSFQSEDADLGKACQELKVFFKKVAKSTLLSSSIVHATRLSSIVEDYESNHDIDMDLFVKYIKNAISEKKFIVPNSAKFSHQFDEALKLKPVPYQNMNTVKENCLVFLQSLLSQLVKRIPQHLHVLEKSTRFMPVNVLKEFGRPNFNELPIELLDLSFDKSLLEIQWENLAQIKWTYILSPSTLKSSDKFWCHIYNVTNSIGEFSYREIARFAIRVLCLPLSNAVVERVFSIMALTHTKIRNRMLLEMLQAIIRLKVHVYVHKQCCLKFVVSKDMIARHCSQMYKNDNLDPNTEMLKDNDIGTSSTNIEYVQVFDEASELCQNNFSLHDHQYIKNSNIGL